MGEAIAVAGQTDPLEVMPHQASPLNFLGVAHRACSPLEIKTSGVVFYFTFAMIR